MLLSKITHRQIEYIIKNFQRNLKLYGYTDKTFYLKPIIAINIDQVIIEYSILNLKDKYKIESKKILLDSISTKEEDEIIKKINFLIEENSIEYAFIYGEVLHKQFQETLLRFIKNINIKLFNKHYFFNKNANSIIESCLHNANNEISISLQVYKVDCSSDVIDVEVINIPIFENINIEGSYSSILNNHSINNFINKDDKKSNYINSLQRLNLLINTKSIKIELNNIDNYIKRGVITLWKIEKQELSITIIDEILSSKYTVSLNLKEIDNELF